MIYWHLRDHGDPGAPSARAGDYDFLSSEERRRLADLKFEKKRGDWLLGRWTAKLMLCGYMAQESDTAITLDAVTVANEPSGAPVARFATSDEIAPNAVSLSISHSHGRALTAFSDEDGVMVGADIELVESRSANFAGDYFTAAEIAGLETANESERDELITAIWSAKESVLKALHLGLRVDTRRVCCSWQQPPSSNEWRRFAASFDDPETDGGDCSLSGWWRLDGPYVMTLASLRRNSN